MSAIDIIRFVAVVLCPSVQKHAKTVFRYVYDRVKKFLYNEEVVEVISYERKQIANEIPLFGDLNTIPGISYAPRTIYGTQWQTRSYISGNTTAANVIYVNYPVIQSRIEYEPQFRTSARVEKLDVVAVKYARGGSFATNEIMIDYKKDLEDMLAAHQPRSNMKITLHKYFGVAISISLDEHDAQYHSMKNMMALLTYSTVVLVGASFVMLIVHENR